MCRCDAVCIQWKLAHNFRHQGVFIACVCNFVAIVIVVVEAVVGNAAVRD